MEWKEISLSLYATGLCYGRKGEFDMLTRKDIENLRVRYPKGVRVRLIHMDDVQAPPVGCMGTVRFVDDIGTIHVAWDNGSSLGIVYGVDEIEIG